MDSKKSLRERSLQRQKKRDEQRKRLMIPAIFVGMIILLLIVCIVIKCCGGEKKEKKVENQVTQTPSITLEPTVEPTATPPAFTKADKEKKFPKNVKCKYGILVDVEDGTILASRKAKEKMYPASMTKVMTVLVASELVSEEQLDDKIKITRDITDFTYSNDCSIANFLLNEKVTVRDCFYGTILPSGADAALGLAKYVAGSHEEFVKLMNKKADELGIGQTTHFTNCVGIYNDKHYSTCYDMAVILKAASDNEFCSQVLNARTYTTSITKKHKEGVRLSNLFLRRIEDRFKTGDILYAKTGFVNQSLNCAVSMAEGADGHRYLCATAGSQGSWQCIADQMNLYAKYGTGIEKVKE